MSTWGAFWDFDGIGASRTFEATKTWPGQEQGKDKSRDRGTMVRIGSRQGLG